MKDFWDDFWPFALALGLMAALYALSFYIGRPAV